MSTVERLGAIISLVAVIASVAVTFGIQMERLSRLMEDVKELRERQAEVMSRQEEIMQAIGQMEHKRWRDRQR